MKKLIALSLFAAAVFGTCAAWGQSEIDRLNARLDSLEQRLERQTARSERWGRAVEKLPKV